MPAKPTSKPTARPRVSRLVACGLLVVAGLALTVYGRNAAADFAQRRAVQRLDDWALSEAERYLMWAEWLRPGHAETDLLRAVCFRRWGQMARWRSAMEAVESSEMSRTPIEIEIGLSVIRSGEQHDWIPGAQRELAEAGVPPDDIGTAFLDGYLARGDYPSAQQFLTQWEAKYPQRAHVAYLWGFFWLQLKDYEQAHDRFRQALEVQPGHELARKMLAELLEMQDRLDEAVAEHAESLRRAPTSRVAKLGLARTLRKLNRADAARTLLEELAAESDPLPVAIYELGQLELEAGNFSLAQERFGATGPLDQIDHDQLLSSAIAASLAGDKRSAQSMVVRSDALSSDMVRKYDLQLRLSMDPANAAAASELQQLLQVDSASQQLDQQSFDPSTSHQLYRQHCSACHGVTGRGDGRAARHLFPRARNLRHDRLRLVSTSSGVPTLDDVINVIVRGIPGTSMPPFPDLDPNERRMLAEEVLRIRRDGLREKIAAATRREGEQVIEEEVNQQVRLMTEPTEVLPPVIGPEPNAALLQYGKEVYAQRGCAQCHGAAGQPSVDETALFDESHLPVPPRDLAYDPFKGGHDFEAIYRRIVLGMPGSPHPGNQGMPQQEISALVLYCRSLAVEPKRSSTNYQRRIAAYDSAQPGRLSPN